MSTCKIWCQMRETKTKRGEPAFVILEIAVKQTDFKIEGGCLWYVYGFVDGTNFDPKKFIESLRWWTDDLNVPSRSARSALKRGIDFKVSRLTRETRWGKQPLWNDLDVGDYSVSINMNRKRLFHPDYHVVVRKCDGYEFLALHCHSDQPRIYYFQLNSGDGRRAIDLGLLRDLLRPYTPGERGVDRKLAREEGIVVTIPQDDIPRLIERIKEAADWDEFFDSSQGTAEKTTADTKIDDKTEQAQ
ncbi:MAG: hypothetical protein IJH68_06495 [Thermoguttaceae bacterium]|nr:hypothetical protein [Thermoguttaceae bacterium]